MHPPARLGCAALARGCARVALADRPDREITAPGHQVNPPKPQIYKFSNELLNVANVTTRSQLNTVYPHHGLSDRL
jgi:hypothetical protein